MKSILQISTIQTGGEAEVARYLVAIDETVICLSEGERAVDILIECLNLSRSSPKTHFDVVRPLQSVREKGHYNLMCAIPAGAFYISRLDAHFAFRADHHIDITVKTDGNWTPEITLSLDHSDTINTVYGDLTIAPERNGDTGRPVFWGNYSYSKGDATSSAKLTSGSLLAGACAALFEGRVLVRRHEFCQDHVLLLCAMAAVARSGQYNPTRSNAETRSMTNAISSGADQYASFLADGYLISERAWNPDYLMRGPRLNEALGLADTGLREFAKRTFPEISIMDPRIAQEVLRCLLAIHKVDETQVSHYLPRHQRLEMSNHNLLIIQGHTARMNRIMAEHQQSALTV